MNHTLRIELLGHFQLHYDDAPVAALRQARLQSLLAYLALHSHEVVLRQQISFLYWPDANEAQARANLRKALFDLRAAIPQVDEWLQIETQTLAWRTGLQLAVDVGTFAEIVGQTELRVQPPNYIALLEQAVTLYTGDLLPASYDDWVLRERERLHKRYVNALERLIHLLEEQRDYAAAIAYAQQLQQDDPLLESTYRTLMRLYLQRGDRAHALA